MSDELVERIAKAICRAYAGSDAKNPAGVEIWVSAFWPQWTGEARAVLSEISAAGRTVIKTEELDELRRLARIGDSAESAGYDE